MKLFPLGILGVLYCFTIHSMDHRIIQRLVAVQENKSLVATVRVPTMLDQLTPLQSCNGFLELIAKLVEYLGRLELSSQPISQQTQCNRLNGVLFELEAAHRINKTERVRGFNLTVSLARNHKHLDRAEFDVVTDTTLYECKSVTHWDCSRYMHQFLTQRRFINEFSSIAPVLLSSLNKLGSAFAYQKGKAITLGSYQLFSNWVCADDPVTACSQLHDVIALFSNKRLKVCSKFAIPNELGSFLERESIPFAVIDNDDAQDTDTRGKK